MLFAPVVCFLVPPAAPFRGSVLALRSLPFFLRCCWCVWLVVVCIHGGSGRIHEVSITQHVHVAVLLFFSTYTPQHMHPANAHPPPHGPHGACAPRSSSPGGSCLFTTSHAPATACERPHVHVQTTRSHTSSFLELVRLCVREGAEDKGLPGLLELVSAARW